MDTDSSISDYVWYKVLDSAWTGVWNHTSKETRDVVLDTASTPVALLVWSEVGYKIKYCLNENRRSATL